MHLDNAIRTAFAGAAAVALLATALAPGVASAAAPGGELRVFTLEPVSLVPSEASDQASTLVIRQLYRGLVDYHLDGIPVPGLAESIESDDNQVWTIGIKPGHSFHDGSLVGAAAFIRAWQHAAGGPNGQLFTRIADLELIDARSFAVTLAEPFGGFPAMLGHPAFSPLAQSCIDDLELCREEPIGNGPYLISGAWQPGVGGTLVRNDDFPDPGQALPDSLRYQVYPDLGAGCDAFQTGQLDVLFPIPPPCRPGMVTPPGDGYFAETSNTVSQLGLPSYVDALDDPLVRRALSLAVDWEHVVEVTFDGRLTLADGLVGPHVAGWRPGVCTDCRYDPLEAADLLAQAGGWQGGELALWAPAGSGHESWLAVVGQQLQANLGIANRLEVGLDLPAYLALAEAGGFTGPFWHSWDPGYPVLDAYLEPQFRTGAAANYTGYANPQVDVLLAEGAAALDPTEAIMVFQQAEDAIVTDLPVVPMWFEQWEAVYSDRVDQLAWNLFTGPEYGLTTLHQP